ncbi:hypothetical protein DPMN_110526 [Dreissena polymorpha]|uniref:Uncharacterized protein n=1 Tax=Dreissena polymorpha TaxID=45954 RepID=A0A9D4KD58_DREPO|nr:hypothetical protein DPMN_110526 [Dreissena polymorpha]
MDCLNQAWFFVILGPTTCNSSWNISGPILVKFLKAAESSAIIRQSKSRIGRERVVLKASL